RPVLGRNRFPGLGGGEPGKDLQGPRPPERSVGAERGVAPGRRRGNARGSAAEARPVLQRFCGSFCSAVATTVSSSSGTSLRSVWIGGGVAYTIWWSSFWRLPARNGRAPVSSSYIMAPSE